MTQLNIKDSLTYETIISRFTAWAEVSGKVQAAFVIGSRARLDRPADEYSDLDLVLVVDDPNCFLSADDWLNAIGCFNISFDEYTIGGARERRVLFDGALDVDFLLFTKAQYIECTRSPEFLSLFARGYRALLDNGGFSSLITDGIGTLPSRSMMSPQEFANLVNNFWYHTVWAAKKLKRGELWVAKHCVDGYMKGLLLRMIECHACALHGDNYETWHGGRFLESWADPVIVAALPATFGQYDLADLERALHEMTELFGRLGREAADVLGYPYPIEAERAATGCVPFP